MIAILGGLGAAAAWALSTVCSSRSSRMLHPLVVVAWVMLVGLLVTAPVALAGGVPASLHGRALMWLLLAGAGNVAGLCSGYAGMRIGAVALVAPLMSTEGGIAALIAILAGESVSAGVGVALALALVGVLLVAAPEGELVLEARTHHLRAVAFALGAAGSFGVSLYAAGRAGGLVPSSWVVLSARVVGAVVLALPLALRGRLRLLAAAVPLLITSGIAEVLGFFSFTAGARHGIAVAAVLSSQFAVLAALGGYLLFGERLSRRQVVGVAVVVAGVALLSLLRA